MATHDVYKEDVPTQGNEQRDKASRLFLGTRQFRRYVRSALTAGLSQSGKALDAAEKI